mmetsp:Transcript_39525/g.58168  ORF Transcript_39525/g.58168 Transcript_39525/m.58168 type:complete len:210 (-) Transcript_39525:329-958(-)
MFVRVVDWQHRCEPKRQLLCVVDGLWSVTRINFGAQPTKPSHHSFKNFGTLACQRLQRCPLCLHLLRICSSRHIIGQQLDFAPVQPLGAVFDPGFQHLKSLPALGLQQRTAIGKEFNVGQICHHSDITRSCRIRLEAGQVGKFARTVDYSFAHDLVSRLEQMQGQRREWKKRVVVKENGQDLIPAFLFFFDFDEPRLVKRGKTRAQHTY